METMALGLLAVTFLILSGCCLYFKKPLLCVLGNAVAVALTCFAAHSWKLMLFGSGKDPRLLGFRRYPAAPMILVLLLLAALVLVVLSVLSLAKHGRNKK